MKHFLLFFLAILISYAGSSQCTTVAFQPDITEGKDAFVNTSNPAGNNGNVVSIVVAAWTSGGSPLKDIGLLQFDLSSIPTNATIVTAKLSLYADPSSIWGNAGQPTYGNNNASYLKQITSAWTEAGVNYNNAPSSSAANQLLLAQSTSTNQDYTDIDVALFAQDWVSNPSQNFGMMIDMITSTQYNSMMFCSSDHPTAAKRPKLEVCYTLPETCITLQPDSATGKDAFVNSSNPSGNNGNVVNIVTAAWTSGGSPLKDIGLLEFDLSSVPANAIVTSALLSLYADPSSIWGNTGQPTYGINNASYLKKITAAWNETNVSYTNVPSATTVDQILLPQSSSTNQDYLDIDIAAFAQQWVDNPLQNSGMMIDMITSTQYNSMIFCSSDHPTAAKRPKLELCYTTATAIIDNNKEKETLLLFPNPATNQFFIETNGTAVSEVNIYNTAGSLVSQTKQPQTKSIDISQLANGVYIAEIKTKEASVMRRWVKM